MKLNLLKKISKALGLTEEVRVENEGVLEDIVTLVDKIKEEHNYINSNEKYTDISLIFELPDGNRIFPRKINRMEDISPGCITPNYYPDISDRVLLEYQKNFVFYHTL